MEAREAWTLVVVVVVAWPGCVMCPGTRYGASPGQIAMTAPSANETRAVECMMLICGRADRNVKHPGDLPGRLRSFGVS